MNALHWASRKNLTDIVRLLLYETLIDANEQTNKGWTALHEAAFHNSIEVTRILLEHHPRLLKNEDGDTTIDDARKEKNGQIIESLKNIIFVLN